MDTGTKASLTAVAVVGYLLGRAKKGKLALGLISLVAGRQLPLSPREIASLGLHKLKENPQFAPLVEQARGEALQAGRAALSATANRRLEAVANALEQRTNALLELPEAEAEDAEEEGEAGEGEDEEEREEEEEEEAVAEKARRRPKKRPAGGAKKAPAKRKPEERPAAKKSSPKKAAEKNRSSRDSRRR